MRTSRCGAPHQLPGPPSEVKRRVLFHLRGVPSGLVTQPVPHALEKKTRASRSTVFVVISQSQGSYTCSASRSSDGHRLLKPDGWIGCEVMRDSCGRVCRRTRARSDATVVSDSNGLQVLLADACEEIFLSVPCEDTHLTTPVPP